MRVDGGVDTPRGYDGPSRPLTVGSNEDPDRR
jgi:hypothetical protein